MPDPGRVLRRALLGWGLGHVELGRPGIGWGLLAVELVAIALLAWLTIGLADTSAYLVPFLAGVAFLVAWAWQAIAAYRAARRAPAVDPPGRSAALSIGWLSVPLLAWGAGFWLIGADAASPSTVLDRFVSEWNAGTLDTAEWPADVVAEARAASEELDDSTERLRDLRLRVEPIDGDAAIAVAEVIHYERRDARFLGVFPGSDLVPVVDRSVLTLDLIARSAELPGGGDIGAVRWEITDAARP